jgi:predicted dehydrogenase/threonine dehydrogenase-like Zn-dependent dehydrogenase
MKQLILSYKDGNIRLAEVPAPVAKPGGVLVRNAVSLISPGTEKLMIETGQKSLLGKARARPDLVRQAWDKARKEGYLQVWEEARNRLDEAVPLGYSAAGVALEVGAGVGGIKPGDRVAAAGAGFASHAELVWVPANLCFPIPAELAFEAAAFVTLGGIALNGVRQAGLTLGETAVVIGLGLLGLLTVQLLTAQGCRVIGVDLDRAKAELARELGAAATLVSGEVDVAEAVANASGGRGADGVIITAASEDSQPLRLAEEVARNRARLVLVGVAELSLTRKTFWEKELSFTVAKAAGPGSLDPAYEAHGPDYPTGLVRWTERRNLEAFLELLAQGKVRVDRLITHRFAIQEAPAAYDLILKNREPHIGVLLFYPWAEGAAAQPTLKQRKVYLKTAPGPAPEAASPRAAGLIGGGAFTKNILLPALKKVRGLNLVGVATTTGVTAHHIARKFGFAYATTDYREILADAAIGSVLITTRHDSHAALVVEALNAGKHVFVEKPLCLTGAELAKIEAAYEGTRLLMVGFNRRFAPLAREIKALLANRRTPLLMLYRVNAGFIPEGHWSLDPEVGGGRLLGEVCHFIDFLHYLTDSAVIDVNVSTLTGAGGKYRADDNLCLNLKFADGSLGTILYTAKGPKAFSRERVEVFGEDAVATIEDFRRARLVQGSRSRAWRKLSMDLGYQQELEYFFQEAENESGGRPAFSDLAASTRATLEAAAALRGGR